MVSCIDCGRFSSKCLSYCCSNRVSCFSSLTAYRKAMMHAGPCFSRWYGAQWSKTSVLTGQWFCKTTCLCLSCMFGGQQFEHRYLCRHSCLPGLAFPGGDVGSWTTQECRHWFTVWPPVLSCEVCCCVERKWREGLLPISSFRRLCNHHALVPPSFFEPRYFAEPNKLQSTPSECQLVASLRF